MEANNERVQKRVDWAQANEERETAERLNGRMVRIPAYREGLLTLVHTFDDQYIGVMSDGMDFLRESASALKPYLVA